MISVIVAMYNGKNYILEQLESLLNQNMEIDEVLIGDDGSEDGSVELVENWIKKNNLSIKWKVIKNTRNYGHAGNFINLCRMSKAQNDEDIIFLCDQDDIWHSNKITVMSEAVKKNRDIQVLSGKEHNFKSIENQNKQINITIPDPYIVEFSHENFFHSGLGCCMCMRASFVKKILGYWVEGWEHDMFFWGISVLMGGTYYLPYEVIERRLHANNSSFRELKTREKRLKQIDSIVKRGIQLKRLAMSEKGLDKKKNRFIEKYYKVALYRQKVLYSRNLLLGMGLIFFKRYYLRKYRGVFLDLYLCIFSTYQIK